MEAINPVKFSKLQELDTIGNCTVQVFGSNPIKSNEFSKEKELSAHIEKNIIVFCADVLEDKYIRHDADKPILKRHSFSPRGKSVDLIIECDKCRYIIELKNPTALMENRQGIGQLLDYGREFFDAQKRTDLLLITTSFDISTAKTIKHYNLPIRYMYLDKKRVLEYYG